MAEATVEQVECGFCVTRLEDLEDSRSLPCSHVHCLRCLLGNFEVNKIVRCPFCREVFDVDIHSLPTSNTREGPSLCCDSCTRKGVNNQPAVIYCKTCSTKLCAKHRESHDDVLGAHPMITMTDYKTQAMKLAPRLCTKHTELPYSLGCRKCLTCGCVECLSVLENCTDGSPHKLMSLKELVTELSKEVDGMGSEILDREDKLSDLLKHMTGVLCDYDSETRDMIETLHRTRDEQIESIQQKYKKLEEELIELRRNTKLELERFTEQDVGVKLSDLNRHRLQIEARHKHNHQVDIINRHGETINQIKELLSGNLPTLKLSNMATLEVKGERREVEVEVVTSKSVSINLKHELTTPDTLPTQLSLLHTVPVFDDCPSVCSYEGNTYVGLNKGIWQGRVDIIDEDNQLSRKFVKVGNLVLSVAVYKDRLYTLVYDNPYTVTVHDLTGKLITNWTHTDHWNGYISQLAVVSDQVVIPDRQNKRLTVYSLTGEVIKHIQCPLLSIGHVSMCAVDNLSVVVSDYETAKVFEVNIPSGEVEWTSQDVLNPESVAYHGGRVFVTNYSNTTRVWVLDVNTGKLLTEISDAAIRTNSNVYDLHVTGNTLIVPRYNEHKVLFYQID